MPPSIKWLGSRKLFRPNDARNTPKIIRAAFPKFNFSLIILLDCLLTLIFLKIRKRFAADEKFIHICLNNETKANIYDLVVANVQTFGNQLGMYFSV
jgi:hypothetical protein